MVFIGEIYVFLQISWIRLFGTNFHLENYDFQEVLISKLTQLLEGNNELEAPAFKAAGFQILFWEFYMFL
jgi:hypothetical protein